MRRISNTATATARRSGNFRSYRLKGNFRSYCLKSNFRPIHLSHPIGDYNRTYRCSSKDSSSSNSEGIQQPGTIPRTKRYRKWFNGQSRQQAL